MLEQMIDVGGYRLNVHITGNGSPPVVLLAASGGAHDLWEDSIVPQLAELTTCVTYGRAGLGDSDPLPDAAQRPAGGSQAATDELHALPPGCRPPAALRARQQLARRVPG